jgi:hypothetical protein
MPTSAEEASTTPQWASFSPSKTDILQSLAFFFGEPAVPEKLKDYNEHHAMTCAR